MESEPDGGRVVSFPEGLRDGSRSHHGDGFMVLPNGRRKIGKLVLNSFQLYNKWPLPSSQKVPVLSISKEQHV
jgi:hypothetical protein